MCTFLPIYIVVKCNILIYFHFWVRLGVFHPVKDLTVCYFTEAKIHTRQFDLLPKWWGFLTESDWKIFVIKKIIDFLCNPKVNKLFSLFMSVSVSGRHIIHDHSVLGQWQGPLKDRLSLYWLSPWPSHSCFRTHHLPSPCFVSTSTSSRHPNPSGPWPTLPKSATNLVQHFEPSFLLLSP